MRQITQQHSVPSSGAIGGVFHFINFIKTNDTGISMPSQNLPINSTGCRLLSCNDIFSPTKSLAASVQHALCKTTDEQSLITTDTNRRQTRLPPVDGFDHWRSQVDGTDDVIVEAI